MRIKQTFQIGVVAVLLIAATAACGVKSSPKFPEDATYPIEYPELKNPAASTQTQTETPAKAPVSARTGTYGTPYTRQPRRNPDNVYTPPPPATELLVK